jgi:diguanylate cyclase (GGDEF)-like protein
VDKQIWKILIADDDESLAKIVIDNLKVEGYSVVYAKDGQEACDAVCREMPDLVILDVNMPKKDGYQVLKELKSDILLSNIPVIMLTCRSYTKDKVIGINLGVDDYITKPYDIEELLARVKMILRRTSLYIGENPLTKLPGNNSIEYAITEKIRTNTPFAVLYLDINDFKPYNDYYGFSIGDNVIKEAARIILQSIKELNFTSDFIGHVGGDDFIIVTAPERIDSICKLIISKFSAAAPAFYKNEDIKRGFIFTKDRQGVEKKFPVLSIAIGVISSLVRPFSSMGEVSKIGSEMKSYAKSFKEKGSCYLVDKRKI